MKKVVWVLIFVLITSIFVISRFYNSIQDAHFQEKEKAVEIAYDKTVLTKATKVESFYGDEAFQIVYGEDKIGQKAVVWVSKDDVHTEMASDAFTEEQVKQTIAKKDPSVEILRIMPGKLQNDYIWEVFYKKRDDSGDLHFYDYYKFADGSYIDTYRLNLH